MKIFIIYTPESDHARIVDEFVRNFKIRTERELQMISTNTIEGARTAGLYDIVRYPAVVITRDDGALVYQCQGENLPLIGDLIAYLAS